MGGEPLLSLVVNFPRREFEVKKESELMLMLMYARKKAAAWQTENSLPVHWQEGGSGLEVFSVRLTSKRKQLRKGGG